MGFFSRLFGGDAEEKNDGNESAAAASGSSGMLRTSRNGGLDKTETLLLIDKLNAEIMVLEEAKKARDNGAPYDLPQMREISMPRQVNKGGFAEEDAASYVSQLVGRIEQLRSELGC